VANAELVPDVGVVDREIGDHKIGEHQLLKHVGADIARPQLLIGAEGFQACPDQGGLDEALEHRVEIDRLAIPARLGAKGHHHEGVGLGGHGDPSPSPAR
jgi:hypothetical protein